MNMSTITLFSNSQIAAATATLTLPEKGNASCSVKVVNSSVYPLLITATSQGGAPVEVLPPYTFAIMPNPVSYTASLLVDKGTGLSAPANQYVTVTYIDQVMNYQFGPISELAAGSVPNGLVVNDSSSPVNTQAVIGSPVATTDFVAVPNTTPTQILSSGGVLQKLIVSIINNSSTTTPANSVVYIFNGSSANCIASIPAGNLAQAQCIIPVTFDFSPGVNNQGISAYSEQSGVDVLMSLYAVL